MTKQLFISQPMSGLSDEEITEKRQEAIVTAMDIMKESEVKVLDSFQKGVPAEANPVYYLGESVKILSQANVAYFVKGWESSKGCRVEHLICELYGIEIYEED